MKIMSLRHRSAFSLVELLVVIAIIGILISILLPAIQAARGAARRIQCSDNLKQIALGFHSYHDVHGNFPMASHWRGRYYSAFTAILPYLDRNNVFERYDTKKSVFDPANSAIANREISTYRCPEMVLLRVVPDTSAREVGAASSYAVCNGSESVWGRVQNGAIVTHDRGTTGFRSIMDGTSNTFLIGELDYGLSNYKFSTGAWRGGVTSWSIGYPGYSIATTVGVYNSDRLITGFREFETFRSDHPGGCYFALVDGSVQFVSNQTDAFTLDAFATRNGQEANSDLSE